MRFMFWVGLTFSLMGCATSTVNHYTQTVQSWRGGKVDSLLEHWGTPDSKMITHQGNTVYVYKTESYRADTTQTGPVIGLSGNDSRPVSAVNTNNTWNRGRQSVSCNAIFVANAKGLIIETQIQGHGCYGGQHFADKRSNPKM